jgi:protein-S-isoprenylcysteine O-methyltransferase Ste14
MIIGVVVVAAAFRLVPAADWQPLMVGARWAHVLGLAILAAATGFTLWARVALGTMWSAAPMVKQEHQLRTGGPYGITRHPIYTGILGMLLGTGLLAGAGRWALIFPVGLVIAEIKIHLEEGLMLATFPADYPRYRQRVPQLVPGLRLIRRRHVADA